MIQHDLPQPVESAIDQAVERIGNRFHGSPVVLRGMLAKPINEAYHLGRHDAWQNLETTESIARLLGVTSKHVRLLSMRMGIGRKIGRDIVFTPAEVEQLRNRPDGRRC